MTTYTNLKNYKYNFEKTSSIEVKKIPQLEIALARYQCNHSIWELALIDNVSITNLIKTNNLIPDNSGVGGFNTIEDDKLKCPNSCPSHLNVYIETPLKKVLLAKIKPLKTTLNVQPRIRKNFPVGYVMWQIAKVCEANLEIENLFIEEMNLYDNYNLKIIIN